VAGLARRLGLSVGAAWLVLCVELVLVAALDRRLVDVWELQHGIRYLAPIALPGAALLGLVGLALFELLVRATRPRPHAVLVLLSGIAAASLGWALGGGRHLASLSTRGSFALALALVATGLVYLLAPRLARAVTARPGAVALAAAALILSAELTNRFVLVRLYPAFHAALALAALVLAPLLVLPFEVRRRTEPAAGRLVLAAGLAPVVLGLALTLLAVPAARRLATFDNFRLVLSDQAPLLKHAVAVAARLAPPPALPPLDCEDVGQCAPTAPSGAPGAGGAFALDGRSILLVSIDALRADHVGAYGYSRRTTPRLDELGAQGVLFEYAYAPTPHTSYSVSSLMTGKYMRPLALQGAGGDSDTFAGILRTYGYGTAAFYPPAVFFIDAARFENLSSRFLDFEYRKVEFAEGQRRVEQLRRYLAGTPAGARIFVWVHLFGPHEPYEKHAGLDFGDRDVDRYDSEIAFADKTLGDLVQAFRAARPDSLVMVTSDHGEEFGEHGGRYHGTTVYEEQVRVPLVFHAPGTNMKPRRIREPVQTIDVLPTVLAGLRVPIPPRMRGRDLGPLLTGGPEGPGLAYAETEDQALLARGTLRLVCNRKLGACALYDIETDPGQKRDLSQERREDFARLRDELRRLGSSHGRFEVSGLRAEGRDFPPPILRGIAGDGDAAEEIAALLDDADRVIRRKAAQLLFELRRSESAPALRLALARDEDGKVRKWSALALTRLGQGAPLTFELIDDDDVRFRRLAALALAETGDARGAKHLVDWWNDAEARDYARSLELLSALAEIRATQAELSLIKSLDDVRLRPHIARTLAVVGGENSRAALGQAFAVERYQTARAALAAALADLRGGPQLTLPLIRFLGMPDPPPDGLREAARSKILARIGGPRDGDLERIQRQSQLGVGFSVIVPAGGNGSGVRVLVRARTTDAEDGQVIVGPGSRSLVLGADGRTERSRKKPEIDPLRSVRLRVRGAGPAQELFATLPAELRVRPGYGADLVLFADRNVVVEAVAVVPLADELPPPPPEPWQEGAAAAAPGLQTAD
jgi:hypothetical protein